MKTEKQELIQIKKTKSVEMSANEKVVELVLFEDLGFSSRITIPMSKVFQVKRGLESAVQRFYRKHEKVKKDNSK